MGWKIKTADNGVIACRKGTVEHSEKGMNLSAVKALNCGYCINIH
jgi:hypothetical protein